VTETRARHVETIMGIPISLALRGPQARSERADAAWEAIVAELRDVDRVFSTYRDDSHVSRLSRGEIELSACPSDVGEVLRIGAEAEALSSGAFAVHRAEGRTPVLDPSGVVKGWALERSTRHLQGLETTDYCLSAGGDMVCHVDASHGTPWRIGIENPLDPTRFVAVVPVWDGAVATSGTAHRGDHIVDPRTGLAPIGVASVTVVGNSLTWVDIEATAAYAHGPDALTWLRHRTGRTGLVVWADGRTDVFRSEDPLPGVGPFS
jgi:thiamine biosynthesis lipoprotein